MKNMANHKLIQSMLPGCLAVVLLSGCYKYKDAPQLSSPAYLRVFNSIPSKVNALTASQQHFLCFLFDPAFDASGVPAGGAVVGDWLQTRELYSLSYPIDAGTALNAGNGSSAGVGGAVNYVTNANYEYPGKMHVLTAPPMNGLDLSSWAQVPSGKHRLVFVVRPQSNTPFGELGSSLRRSILIDTTVNLTAGEVYTLDAVITNPDSNYFGAYIRKEQFIHQAFDTGRLYAAFYNLSGKPSFLSSNFNYPDFWNYPDTLAVNYTYRVYDDLISPVTQNGGNDAAPARPLPGSNNVYFGTVIRGRDDLSAYAALPFLSRSYFFNQKSILRTYWEYNSNTGTGTLPFVALNFFSRYPQHAQFGYGSFPTLLCTADPATFNTFDPDALNNSLADVALGSQYPGLYVYQPNLNLVVQSAGAVNIVPTINLFEIIYNRIYLMQIPREFVKVPQ